jgi:hypothetical protein
MPLAGPLESNKRFAGNQGTSRNHSSNFGSINAHISRRLFKWKEKRFEEVVSAKAEWQPFIVSLQLSKPILPWGRLYFVLDKNTESNPFWRGEFPILRCLNSHANEKN